MIGPFSLNVFPDTVAWPCKQFFDRKQKTFVKMENPMYKIMNKKMFQGKSVRACFLSAIITIIPFDAFIAV